MDSNPQPKYAKNDETSVRPSETDPAVKEHAFRTGQIVAERFEVIHVLGRGGMGQVYQVRDIELGNEFVALKTLLPGLHEADETIRRFKREIRLARRVTHPNACRIFDVGYHRADGGVPLIFVTMEYLDGSTLREQVSRRGRFSTHEALPIIRHMCAGLEAIHSAGILHRDFKSSNVMIVGADASSRAVVTDFGLARLTAAPHDHSSITSSGMIVGSPLYMAPEQFEGRELTIQTDIYALGIVIFEMLTGQFPFEFDSPLNLALKRLNEPARSPRDFVSDIDPRWESVILRCLDRNPASRFTRAPDVIHSLTDSSDASTIILAKTPSLMKFTRRTAAVLTMLGASILSATLMFWNRRAADQAETKPFVPPSAQTRPDAAARAPQPTRVAGVPPAATPIEVRRTTDSPFASVKRLFGTVPPAGLRFATLSKKTRFKAGEMIEYEVSAPSSGYLYVIIFTVDGKATQLFPNPIDPDNRVSAGLTRLPRNKSYRFPIEPPFGTDLHVAVLSKSPLPLKSQEAFTWDEVSEALDPNNAPLTGRGVRVRRSEMPWQAVALELTAVQK